jgi:hypothetical protein
VSVEQRLERKWREIEPIDQRLERSWFLGAANYLNDIPIELATMTEAKRAKALKKFADASLHDGDQQSR